MQWDQWARTSGMQLCLVVEDPQFWACGIRLLRLLVCRMTNRTIQCQRGREQVSYAHLHQPKYETDHINFDEQYG